MDDLDRAEQNSETQRMSAISNRKKYEGESAADCQQCGEPIPQQRREKLKGVKTCVDCQELIERKGVNPYDRF